MRTNEGSTVNGKSPEQNKKTNKSDTNQVRRDNQWCQRKKGKKKKKKKKETENPYR
jgi:hypothetical protein